MSIQRPPAHLAATDLVRAGLEGMSLLFASGLLCSSPRGDGHGVMVLPGFATDDSATMMLRRFLQMLGYEVHPWRLGWNLDHRTVGLNGEHVAHQIDKIVDATGRRVTLIGWSLGGVIAREAARRDPQAVRQVITMGSPFCGNPHANHVGKMYERLSGNKVDSPAALRRFSAGDHPLPMPSTSIFSRSDGVTAWENCIALTDHQTENVEVHASHFGLVVHPAVYYVVADRLAQPEDDWSPFQRKGPFGIFYPEPESGGYHE